MVNKITVLLAGWTIWMEENSEGKLVPPLDASWLQEACQKYVAQFTSETGVAVDYEFFDTKDSTERKPEDWSKIVKIWSSVTRRSDVIAGVGLHGTDTLGYTAAATGFGFSHPDFPWKSELNRSIVYTAAQKPIKFVNTDGIGNLHHSLHCALEMYRRQINRVVMLGAGDIFIAGRGMKWDESKFNFLVSPGHAGAGVVDSNGVELNSTLRWLPPSGNQLSPDFQRWVALFSSEPTNPSGLLRYLWGLPEVKVVNIVTSWAGNVPSDTIWEVKELVQSGVIVTLCSAFPGGEVGTWGWVYQLWADVIKAWAIPLRDMNPHVACVKLSWLLGYGKKTRSEFIRPLLTNYIGEIAGTDEKLIDALSKIST